MSRTGRFWLFFGIVAVGLVLSWGQVGQKTRQVLEAAPVTYLQVEAGCLANLRPCAAVAGDHALVLGPVREGLLLKQTGFDAETIASVEAVLGVDDPAGEALLPVQRVGDGWLIGFTPRKADGLQVRLAASGRVSVADYPLRAD